MRYSLLQYTKISSLVEKHQYSLSNLKENWQTADVRNSRSRFFRPLSTAGLLYDDL